ncbi:hypothetical protein OSH11_00610 [Kaistia dalseonensis]|uniref:Uncharacterized protein n=1 Tax=Kaistia dalseonensis TaxID=410840 RepID=A0ABU0H0B4_9HYPH|nr:hypothetical protein [Kaistia dalseonensis]MCX5493195.1 hypothetical protein [Kaistia dalseonensis]MDQ0435750.1 hypothetical protein [Kaistia dalseonensis]
MNDDPQAPAAPVQKLDAAFRNGSITAVGIVLGFSLGFTVQWADDPTPWQKLDLVAAAPLLAGLVLQIKSLAELLEIDALEVPVYRRAKNRFLLGLLVTSSGIVVTVIRNALGHGIQWF